MDFFMNQRAKVELNVDISQQINFVLTKFPVLFSNEQQYFGFISNSLIRMNQKSTELCY
jgi:hypothetical protein